MLIIPQTEETARSKEKSSTPGIPHRHKNGLVCSSVTLMGVSGMKAGAQRTVAAGDVSLSVMNHKMHCPMHKVCPSKSQVHKPPLFCCKASVSMKGN